MQGHILPKESASREGLNKWPTNSTTKQERNRVVKKLLIFAN